MAITKFIIDSEVTTVGGDKFEMSSDSKSADFFVLSVNGVQMKMSEQDATDLSRMLSRMVGNRVAVK